MDKKLGDLITDVQRELYQVAGPSVQVYSEEIIAKKIQSAFDLIYADEDWKRFVVSTEYTLDGVTGRTTVSIKNTYSNFDDIIRVFAGSSNSPLPKWSSERNPSAVDGTWAQGWVYDATNVIRIIPYTTDGKITVTGKTGGSKVFVSTDTIPFDHLALVYNAAWQYQIDDGSNPAAVDKFQALFEARMKQLRNNQNREPIPLGGGRSGPATRWEEW